MYGFQRLRSKAGTHWYYFDSTGVMVKGWRNIKTGNWKGWHYFDGDGHEVHGWARLRSSAGTHWYYFDSTGVMAKGWRRLSSSSGTGWHYFDGNGHEVYGFQRLASSKGTHWYYFDSNGLMVTGWRYATTKQGKSGWHYFDGDGHEVYGWQTIGGKRYYFGGDGVRFANGDWVFGNDELWHFDTNGVGSQIIPHYKALLVCQTGESDIGPSCEIDRANMANMLRSVRGPYKGSYQVNDECTNANKDKIRDYIRSYFRGLSGYDVALFYYSGHGAVNYTDGSYVGDANLGAMGYDAHYISDMMTMSELASVLDEIPCRVIVILDSCGSGGSIYPNGLSREQLKAEQASIERFNQAAVDAFAQADSGVWVDNNGAVVDGSGLVSNTGELRRQNKFYVLTAATYRQNSATVSNGGEFTYSLISGIGTSGSMRADADGDNKATLQEVYNYVAREVRYSTPAVYPANSNFTLFCR